MAKRMRYSILVVEDDSIISEDICQAFERHGYEIASTASSGEEAIMKSISFKPDLVLMDIVLKGTVDGIKAAAHIIKELDIPVVYLTSHSDKATFKRAKETGPFGYLMKPYEERDLVATAEMAIYKHAMESKLKGQEQWLTIILKSMGDGVIVSDAEGVVSFMNPASEQLTGQRAKVGVGKPQKKILRLFDGETGKSIPDPSVGSIGDAHFQGSETMDIQSADGAMTAIDGTVYAIKGDLGEASGTVFVFRDVTESRRAQKLLEDSERFLNTIFDSIHDPFCIIDREYKFVRLNDAYARLKGKKPGEILNSTCYESIAKSNGICKDCIVHRTFAEAKPASKEKEQVFEDSSEGWVEIFTYPIFDEDEEVSHVIEYTRDITERKRSEEERKALIKELEYLSTVDPLSGLLNRRAIMDFLNSAIDRAERYSRRLSLMLCDVDNFKDINDVLGHSAGDEAIRYMAEILRSVVRTADIVGRYGGDEFIVVMPETSSRGAEDLAQRLAQALKDRPFKPAPRKKHPITLSMGLASYAEGRDTVDTLISRADAALYKSKRDGRDRITIEED